MSEQLVPPASGKGRIEVADFSLSYDTLDGSVEAVISGADDKVDEMLAYFWQGPSASRVERVDSAAADFPMQLGFRQLPTA